MKYTPWFNGSVKPVRDGVYQRLYYEGTNQEGVVYCEFRGGFWRVQHASVRMAAGEPYKSFMFNVKWRGLTTKGGK